jgi:hypothetical protein
MLMRQAARRRCFKQDELKWHVNVKERGSLKKLICVWMLGKPTPRSCLFSHSFSDHLTIGAPPGSVAGWYWSGWIQSELSMNVLLKKWNTNRKVGYTHIWLLEFSRQKPEYYWVSTKKDCGYCQYPNYSTWTSHLMAPLEILVLYGDIRTICYPFRCSGNFRKSLP